MAIERILNSEDSPQDQKVVKELFEALRKDEAQDKSDLLRAASLYLEIKKPVNRWYATHPDLEEKRKLFEVWSDTDQDIIAEKKRSAYQEALSAELTGSVVKRLGVEFAELISNNDATLEEVKEVAGVFIVLLIPERRIQRGSDKVATNNASRELIEKVIETTISLLAKEEKKDNRLPADVVMSRVTKVVSLIYKSDKSKYSSQERLPQELFERMVKNIDIPKMENEWWFVVSNFYYKHLMKGSSEIKLRADHLDEDGNYYLDENVLDIIIGKMTGVLDRDNREVYLNTKMWLLDYQLYNCGVAVESVEEYHNNSKKSNFFADTKDWLAKRRKQDSKSTS